MKAHVELKIELAPMAANRIENKPERNVLGLRMPAGLTERPVQPIFVRQASAGSRSTLG